jgi:hypothetical protein
MIKSERGAALPLVLIAIALGALVIPSFLNHTDASLISSKAYAQAIYTDYAVDAGVEHGIWNLKFGGLKNQVPDVGNTVSYSVNDTINNHSVYVTVTKIDDKPADEYIIVSESEDRLINTDITIKGNTITIISWNYE